MEVLLAILCVSTVPPADVFPADEVEIAEFSSYHDETGPDDEGKIKLRHVFDQVIFRNWDGSYHEIVAFKMKKGVLSVVRNPSGTWTVFFKNGTYGLNSVTVRRIYRTHSVNVDAEVLERAFLSKEKRRGLLEKLP